MEYKWVVNVHNFKDEPRLGEESLHFFEDESAALKFFEGKIEASEKENPSVTGGIRYWSHKHPIKEHYLGQVSLGIVFLMSLLSIFRVSKWHPDEIFKTILQVIFVFGGGALWILAIRYLVKKDV